MTSYKTIVFAISALCVFYSTHIVTSEANEIRERQENRRLGLEYFLPTVKKLTRKISGSSPEARRNRLCCAALAVGCSGFASAYILSQNPQP